MSTIDAAKIFENKSQEEIHDILANGGVRTVGEKQEDGRILYKDRRTYTDSIPSFHQQDVDNQFRDAKVPEDTAIFIKPLCVPHYLAGEVDCAGIKFKFYSHD